ncbi:receptor-type tyrosine-protein phosphatase F-like isoform X1 [Asterias rubens]|uniref:receptor-type tyrosine-protein phosphatase F-like isoform X1 n=1 Tax=Asterias rubens TaxID=7604 RepID=UPI001454FD3B|nr:receptor-type tyrosine-protein phosphatase F-like isoform X1 [Asterias rubens]
MSIMLQTNPRVAMNRPNSTGSSDKLYSPWFCELRSCGERAITSLSQATKPNAGQPVPLLCEAMDMPSVPGPNALTLTGSDGLEVTASETTVVASNRRVTTFIVTVVDLGNEFTCSLLDSDGTTVVDRQTISVNVYVLPFLQSPPTIVLDYLVSTELTVSWLPWATDGLGDGPVLRYEVVYRNKTNVEGDTSYDYKLGLDSNQTTTARVTGLRTEQEYDFAVVVVREGEGGAGKPSNKTTITTRCAVPTSAPIVVSLTAIGPTELQLVWRLPPPSTWGCRNTPISILINLKESSEDYFGFPVAIETADPPGVFNVTNLLSCTTYDVQLYYTTSAGFSPPSEVINGSTPRTAPPRARLFSLGNAQDGVGLFAQWSPPEGPAKRCDTGMYHVHYTLLRLEACDTDIVSPTTYVKVIGDGSTSTTLDDLVPYATYNVSVVSTNEVGMSDDPTRTWTTVAAFATVLPPVQVTDVTARSFIIRWVRIPCEDLHGDFTAYRYFVTNNKSAEQTSSYIYDIDVTTERLMYRTPCSPYDIQMTLYNDLGEGDRSENVRVTTDAEVPPSVPNVVASSVDENPSELSLTWDEPQSWCPIEYYKVSYELVNKFMCETHDEGVHIVAGNATQLSYTIMDLFPFSTYFVYVEGFTEGAGFGMPGRTVQDTAEKAPTAAPDRLEVGQVFRRELSFSCGYPPCTAGGRSSRILGFTYNLTDLVNPGNPSIVIEGENSRQVFDGLVPNTRYSLQVKLRTNAGDGPYSEPIEATTLEDRPGPPSNVTISEIGETTMTVTWEVPIEPNGIITAYEVYSRAIEKPYNPSFTSPSSWVGSPLLGPSVLSNIITQLDPGTKYQILLTARTAVGTGEDASVEAFTKPKTDIPKPAPPTVDTSTSTATTVAISLPNDEDDTYVTSYLIAVKKTSNKRAAVDIDGEVFGSYNENPNAYIAAEIAKGDKTNSFVVGDGAMYGGYLNAPLVTGTTYSIRTGSASKTDTASIVSWSEPLTAEVRSYGSRPPATMRPDITDPPPMAGDNKVGIIAAVVIVVVLLVVVSGFAVLFYLKKKRDAQEPASTVDQTQMKEREVEI